MDLRDLFNDHRWHRGDLGQLEIVVLHRGAPGDRRVVPGRAVKAVAPNGLIVFDEPVELSFGPEGESIVGDGEVFLPFHRVLEVRGPDGVLWSKPAAGSGEGGA